MADTYFKLEKASDDFGYNLYFLRTSTQTLESPEIPGLVKTAEC